MHYLRPENKYWMLGLCFVRALSSVASHSIIDRAFRPAGDVPTCTGENPSLFTCSFQFSKSPKNSPSNGFGGVCNFYTSLDVGFWVFNKVRAPRAVFSSPRRLQMFFHLKFCPDGFILVSDLLVNRTTGP